MTHPTMRKTFIPEVPRSITRDQLIAATRALGLEPYTVHSITFNADEVTVELGMYAVEKPALSDQHAFRLGPAHQFGASTTATIRVRDTLNGDSAYPHEVTRWSPLEAREVSGDD